MAGIRVVRFGSWAEFKRDLYAELFEADAFEEERYLFRGMGSDDWHLQSSFDRRYAHQLPSEQRGVEAQKLLDLFAEECSAADGHIDPCPDDLHPRIALAQHHGLPTRGLDWTESPYVAGYFAFADAWRFGEDERGQVAIWALDKAHDAWRATDEVVIDSSGRVGNERMIRQRAALTYLHAAAPTLDEYVRDRPEPGDALIKFSLPKADARVALGDLAAMGITSTRLFPDREGAARAALVRYAIRRASPSASRAVSGTF